MTDTLNIGRGVKLPVSAAARTFGLLAMRGAGKSNAAVVMAEEMYRTGIHWVAVDPKGDWWGVRSGRDGTPGKGLDVVIFGGENADMPIQPDQGSEIATAILDDRITCVVDVSDFTEGEKARFLAGHGREEGFAGRLFRRKRRDQGTTHMFLEEAHDYIPQNPRGVDKGKLVDAFGKIVAMGRSRGLGATMITQRAARIHKDVLTQVDTLVVLRIIGPQDRDAVAGWLKYHGESAEILESLAGLDDGEAWMWSPEWLGSTERIQFRRRRTYDSGATPDVNPAGAKPATLKDVDLDALGKRFEKAIERAKAEDPKELQKRIRELERDLAKPTKAEPEVQVERVEVPMVPEGVAKRLREVLEGLAAAGADLSVLADQTSQTLSMVEGVREAPVSPRTPSQARPPRPAARTDVSARRTPTPATRAQDDGGLPKAERAFLTVLAQHGPQERAALATLAGYSVKSRHVDNVMGSLRTKGYVSQGWPAAATPEGLEALGDYDPLPTGAELRHYWLTHSRMPRAGAAFLDVLFDRYPEPIHRDELAEAAGYSKDSRHVDNTLGTLRTMGLAVGGRDAITAADTLFEEG